MQEDGDGSLVLLQTVIPVVHSLRCTFLYMGDTPITPRMLCAGYYSGGHDACQVHFAQCSFIFSSLFL